MNLGTAFVLLIIVAIVALALRATIKKKGSCGCDDGCDCCSSSGGCPAAKMDDLVNQVCSTK